jgi:hypothetical protein
MKDQDKNLDSKAMQSEAMQMESALRHFRDSVHAWSERELDGERSVSVRRQPVRPSAFGWLRGPVMGWGVAGVLAVAAVTVPVSVHHERQLAAARQAATQERQRQVEEAKATLAKNSIDDDELLNHVDSDIVQVTPDAMEPLASMMRDTTVR